MMLSCCSTVRLPVAVSVRSDMILYLLMYSMSGVPYVVSFYV
jgi:hypothetical protein